jgi:recombination protein RecR
MKLARPIERLIAEFMKLPGIGRKSAQRIVFHLIDAGDEDVIGLSDALKKMKESIVECSVCCNVSDSDPCHICADLRRDDSLVCVVEQPSDVAAIEKVSEYRGSFHVLRGRLSPLEGRGPEDIRARRLVERVKAGEITEVIIATNPDVDGEATALYIDRLMKPLGVKVTRLARGLPMGTDLEYADQVTLQKALEGRTSLK